MRSDYLDDEDGYTTLLPNIHVEDDEYDSGLLDQHGNRLVSERVKCGFHKE